MMNSELENTEEQNIVEYFGYKDKYKLDSEWLSIKRQDKKDKENIWYEKNCQYLKIKVINQNLETNEVTNTLRYKFKDNYYTIEVSREKLQTKDIQTLAGKGVDITPYNYKEIIGFLNVQEKTADYMLRHSNLGWYLDNDNNKLLYKHHNIIGKETESTYDGQLSIEPKGSLKAYLKIIKEEVLGNIYLELALVLGFVSVLSSLFSIMNNFENVVIHIYGDTSKGKTTALQVAVSPFGKPTMTGDGLIKNWGSTKNALVGQLTNNFGFPAALDESSMIVYKDLTEVMYMIAEGRGKGRMNKDLSVSKQAEWKTTIISSGESSLQNKMNKNGGLKVRLIEFDNITWTRDAENATNIKNGLLENYGYAGIKFVEYIQSIEFEAIKDRYNKEYKQCLNDFPQSDFKERICQKYAIIILTAKLVKECFSLDIDVDGIIKVLIETENNAIGDRKIGGSALDYIVEKASINIAGFHKIGFSNEEDTEFVGIKCYGAMIKRNLQVEICIYPIVLDEWLNEGGFSDKKVVLNELKKSNYLSHESGKNTNRRTFGGVKNNVYCIKIPKEKLELETYKDILECE